MAVVGGSTPSVSISVPVPQPVTPRPKAPARPQPKPAPQPIVRPPSAAPQPRPIDNWQAVILPWTPGAKRMARRGTPRKYAQYPKSESGILTPEQLLIARNAYENNDLTAWGALGDHLAENGYPNAGAVLSHVGARTPGAQYIAGGARLHGHDVPTGAFRYSLLRDGADLVHRLVLHTGEPNEAHVFTHRFRPERMSRLGKAVAALRLPRRVVKYAGRKKPMRTDGVNQFTQEVLDAHNNSRVNGRWGPSAAKAFAKHPVYDVMADWLAEQNDPREMILRKRDTAGNVERGAEKAGLRFIPSEGSWQPHSIEHEFSDGTKLRVLPMLPAEVTGTFPNRDLSHQLRNGSSPPTHYFVGWEGPGKKWVNALLTRQEFHNFYKGFPEHETSNPDITFDNEPTTQISSEEFDPQ